MHDLYKCVLISKIGAFFRYTSFANLPSRHHNFRFADRDLAHQYANVLIAEKRRRRTGIGVA